MAQGSLEPHANGGILPDSVHSTLKPTRPRLGTPFNLCTPGREVGKTRDRVVR